MNNHDRMSGFSVMLRPVPEKGTSQADLIGMLANAMDENHRLEKHNGELKGLIEQLLMTVNLCPPLVTVLRAKGVRLPETTCHALAEFLAKIESGEVVVTHRDTACAER